MKDVKLCAKAHRPPDLPLALPPSSTGRTRSAKLFFSTVMWNMEKVSIDKRIIFLIDSQLYWSTKKTCNTPRTSLTEDNQLN